MPFTTSSKLWLSKKKKKNPSSYDFLLAFLPELPVTSFPRSWLEKSCTIFIVFFFFLLVYAQIFQSAWFDVNVFSRKKQLMATL